MIRELEMIKFILDYKFCLPRYILSLYYQRKYTNEHSKLNFNTKSNKNMKAIQFGVLYTMNWIDSIR